MPPAQAPPRTQRHNSAMDQPVRPIAPHEEAPRTATRPGRLRWLWVALAWLALGLGFLGIVLPGLPTVPFILAASFCAARGSRKLHLWMRRHRQFGPMIRNWEDHGAISRRAKWLASIMMALCSLLMGVSPSPLWAWATGSTIMLTVAIWLWRRPEA